jgi:HAD superfamily hydrolase (TIGR01662 family)
MTPRLYIFDLDETLAELYSAILMPNTVEVLQRCADQGAQLAIVTNQAGPAWRLATGDDAYPSIEQLADRLCDIGDTLGLVVDVAMYVSLDDPRLASHKLDLSEQTLWLAIELERAFPHCAVSSRPFYRKPEPGMLLQACLDHEVAPGHAFYVGDMSSDELAARAAGIPFQHARAFFRRP